MTFINYFMVRDEIGRVIPVNRLEIGYEDVFVQSNCAKVRSGQQIATVRNVYKLKYFTTYTLCLTQEYTSIY